MRVGCIAMKPALVDDSLALCSVSTTIVSARRPRLVAVSSGSCRTDCIAVDVYGSSHGACVCLSLINRHRRPLAACCLVHSRSLAASPSASYLDSLSFYNIHQSRPLAHYFSPFIRWQTFYAAATLLACRCFRSKCATGCGQKVDCKSREK